MIYFRDLHEAEKYRDNHCKGYIICYDVEKRMYYLSKEV